MSVLCCGRTSQRSIGRVVFKTRDYNSTESQGTMKLDFILSHADSEMQQVNLGVDLTSVGSRGKEKEEQLKCVFGMICKRCANKVLPPSPVRG